MHGFIIRKIPRTDRPWRTANHLAASSKKFGNRARRTANIRGLVQIQALLCLSANTLKQLLPSYSSRIYLLMNMNIKQCIRGGLHVGDIGSFSRRLPCPQHIGYVHFYFSVCFSAAIKARESASSFPASVSEESNTHRGQSAAVLFPAMPRPAAAMQRCQDKPSNQ